MADVRRQRAEFIAGATGVASALTALVFGVWPFHGAPPGEEAPLWDVLLNDRAMLGFVRGAVAAAAIYLIASVPALVARGRWASGFGTGGIVADAAHDHLKAGVDRALAQLETLREENDRLRCERDALLSLIDSETSPE